jgi:hypothetical protein
MYLYKGSDNEESDLFGIPSKKPQNDNDNFDNASSTSKESDEPEEQKHTGGISMLSGTQKGMSELEKAVLRRRKAMGDPDLPPDDDEDVVKNPTKTSNETK